VTDHPSSEELRALYRGELPPARARAVARHLMLEGCTKCQASLPGPLHWGFNFSPQPEITPEEDALYDAAIDRVLMSTPTHIRNFNRRQRRARGAVPVLDRGNLEALEKLPQRMKIKTRVDVLLERSWSMRHENPGLMVQLAELAVHQSKNLDTRRHRHTIQEALDLQGRALGELGNAYRVMDQLDLAAVTLNKARGFLEQGSGDEALRVRLQELEASLAADRRQFGTASSLLLEVQEFHQRNSDRQLIGRILILRGLYTGYTGELESGIGLLQEGLSLVDEKLDPSLVYAAIHNQLLFLVDSGRYQDARRFRFENSRVLRNSGGRINQARFRGLEGRMDLGMGNFARAEMTFREVAQEMEAVGRFYVSAVASLDLAVALLAQGKAAEAERVILAASEVFHRLRIHREGLVALSLLHSAFRLGQATTKLLQDVTAFFRRLDVDPNAMFDGPIW